jgi:hypothetical protein
MEKTDELEADASMTKSKSKELTKEEYFKVMMWIYFFFPQNK